MGLYSFEDALTAAAENLVQSGLAFAQIRDRRLWIEFQSFEAYCRAKWEYGRRYADQLIAAVQLFTQLIAICSQR